MSERTWSRCFLPARSEVLRSCGIHAVYREMRFIPTGGIGPENLHAYLAAPGVIAVGGSCLVKPELLRSSRFRRGRAPLPRGSGVSLSQSACRIRIRCLA